MIELELKIYYHFQDISWLVNVISNIDKIPNFRQN